MARTAKQIADSLRATSAAFYADKITYEELGRRNRKDWAEAEKSPRIKEGVSKLLLADLRAARTSMVRGKRKPK